MSTAQQNIMTDVTKREICIDATLDHPHIPYARQWVDEDDISAVVDVLRSDWLTTGPKVDEFEQVLAGFVGAKEGVAVSSGTAALHAAMYAVGIGPGDEVIVPPMTFVATANAVVYQGGIPIFSDVCPETLLLDPDQVEKKITDRTKAILAVDYAGQPCDYDALRAIADHHGLFLIADACHSLGAEYRGTKVGSLADLTAFSFHPVKHITTGEGGMIVTDRADFAKRLRRFRNHGIDTDHGQRAKKGTWHYEMHDLGYNYRTTDIQSALGISQLNKLPGFLSRRRRIAKRYDEALGQICNITPLAVREEVNHAYHLYVVRLSTDKCTGSHAKIFKQLRNNGIGVNVHYIPVHLHPFYRNRFGTGPGLCPVAEAVFEEIISLPIFPSMNDNDVDVVIKVTGTILNNVLQC